MITETRRHWHQDEELDFARWLPEDDTDIIAAGYRVENNLDSSWLDQRHWFFKLREIILYVVITRDPSVQDDEWCQLYMTGRRESIIDGRPLIEM